jgi:membrane protease YdiL (CAAX protease family)
MGDSSASARNIFFNPENELRSGWRVLIFIITFLLSSLLITVLVSILGRIFPPINSIFNEPDASRPLTEGEVIYAGLNSLVVTIAALAATAFCARLLEGRSLASVGYKLHVGWLRDFLMGAALGAATLAVAVLMAAAAGALRFSAQASSFSVIFRGFAILSLALLIAAAFEEILFRGFIFQALLHNLGPVGAIAITSAAFGLLHVWNPGSTFFSTVNTMLAGVWLSIAYLATRSLWLATALHWSWNFVMVFVFGLPVSGITAYEQMTWLRAEAGSPEWLTGGGYGPEGGVAATVALILSTFIIWKTNLFRVSEQMQVITAHGSLKREDVIPAALAEAPIETESD